MLEWNCETRDLCCISFIFAGCSDVIEDCIECLAFNVCTECAGNKVVNGNSNGCLAEYKQVINSI